METNRRGRAVIMILLGCNKFYKLREKTWENEWDNWYKIPPVVMEMTDYILQDDTKAEKNCGVPHAVEYVGATV